MRTRILPSAARLYPHKADALQAKEARGQRAITCPFPLSSTLLQLDHDPSTNQATHKENLVSETIT
jgi:hypothetical protein